MQKSCKSSILAVLSVLFVLGLSAGNVFAAGPATVVLGAASTYEILSKTAITTTGVTSITGDIGISPAAASALTGFAPVIDGSGTFSTSALISGRIYASDYTAPTPTNVGNAISAMEAAYTDAFGRTPGTGASNLNVGSGTLNGQNFVPGTYTWGSNVDITGNITFTGTASDIWIIQISGTLSLEANKQIILAGGALPQNIFWQVAGTTTVYPSAYFSGVILAGPGASTIHFESSSVLNGQALGQTDVTLIGSTFAIGASAPVVPSTGHHVAPMVTPLIGLIKVPTPLALPNGAGSVTYNYTVTDIGGQQALENVSVVDDKCTPVQYISGDANNNGKLDVNETWHYSCTTNLANTTTNTAIATGYSDDGYHNTALATAIATVVVGTPVVSGGTAATNATTTTTAVLPAPLLNVVKVPNILTALPYGGGNIIYTYTVTNPGIVPVQDVVLTDNACVPVSAPTGDTNNNGVLDTNETWTYTCTTNVPVSTASVATVKGIGNNLPALAYAFTNVLVGTPGLPNTGFPAEGNNSWVIAILAALLVIVSGAYVFEIRKQKV